jgi:uncharacterized protein (TIGR03118 family)
MRTATQHGLSRHDRRPASGATRVRNRLAVSVAAVLAFAAATTAVPAGATGLNRFHQTNLVTDDLTMVPDAKLVDPNLKNPWGLALGPATPLWVADNNAAVATIYSIPPGGASVTKVPLEVAIPGGRPATGDGPSPTGQVFNPTSGFGGAKFIFSSESGQITAWQPSNGTTAAIEYSSPTAVYKGLTMATGFEGTFLYATNFHDGTVDVFNTNFQKVRLLGGFSDPSIPAGYAPFGIQEINGFVYVTYALQNGEKHDDVAGPGHGFIDIYTPDGFRIERLASAGALDSPWGMALAPAGFGPFGGALLVGNFGDGHISVFHPLAPLFLGQLADEHGMPIAIEGLWALHFGTPTTAGTGTLLFSAGINDEQDGLVGSILPS